MSITLILELYAELRQAVAELGATVDVTIGQLDRPSFDAAPTSRPAIEMPWTTPTGWYFGKAVHDRGAAIHFSSWQPPTDPSCHHDPREPQPDECYACAAQTGRLVPNTPAA